jgi:hypothetical protein
MGLLDFVKDAGEKLFGTGKAKASMRRRRPRRRTRRRSRRQRRRRRRDHGVHRSQGLKATGWCELRRGHSDGHGLWRRADQATMEKIVLCCGNVAGVAKVNNMMSVDKSEPEATYYTVVSGDNLSKISKAQYGDANKYMKIYEANTPMLKHPDKIYPGRCCAFRRPECSLTAAIPRCEPELGGRLRDAGGPVPGDEDDDDDAGIGGGSGGNIDPDDDEGYGEEDDDEE